MSIVRGLDSNGDWTFGQGLSDYKSANLQIVQDIQTRLSSFIGNCFFDMAAGINWFGYLSGKDELGLNLAISAVILNTAGVQSILQLGVNLTSSRLFSVSYEVQTIYSVTGSSFQYDLAG